MIDISVQNLVKAFEVDENIIDNISFEVQAGQRVGLLGKNGAGKTTLFRLLVGEISEDEGEIVFGTGKRLGLISQIPDYPERFTAEDVLKVAHQRLYDLQAQMERLVFLYHAPMVALLKDEEDDGKNLKMTVEM